MQRLRRLLASWSFRLAGLLDPAYDVWLDDAPRRMPDQDDPWDPRRPVAEPRPSKLAAWREGHDLRDLATLPCVYGCVDPLTCRYPHPGCSHCFAVRQAADVTASAGDGR